MRKNSILKVAADSDSNGTRRVGFDSDQAVEFGIQLSDTLLALLQFQCCHFGFGFKLRDLFVQLRGTGSELRGIVLKCGDLVAKPDSFVSQLVPFGSQPCDLRRNLSGLVAQGKDQLRRWPVRTLGKLIQQPPQVAGSAGPVLTPAYREGIDEAEVEQRLISIPSGSAARDTARNPASRRRNPLRRIPDLRRGEQA